MQHGIDAFNLCHWWGVIVCCDSSLQASYIVASVNSHSALDNNNMFSKGSAQWVSSTSSVTPWSLNLFLVLLRLWRVATFYWKNEVSISTMLIRRRTHELHQKIPGRLLNWLGISENPSHHCMWERPTGLWKGTVTSLFVINLKSSSTLFYEALISAVSHSHQNSKKML